MKTEKIKELITDEVCIQMIVLIQRQVISDNYTVTSPIALLVFCSFSPFIFI